MTETVHVELLSPQMGYFLLIFIFFLMPFSGVGILFYLWIP